MLAAVPVPLLPAVGKGSAWTPGVVEPGLEVASIRIKPLRQCDQIRFIPCKQKTYSGKIPRTNEEKR